MNTYNQRKANGLCVQCGNKAEGQKTYCSKHLEEMRIRSRHQSAREKEHTQVKPQMIITCCECSTSFTTLYHNQKFCGLNCRNEYFSKLRNNYVKLDLRMDEKRHQIMAGVYYEDFIGYEGEIAA